MTYLLYFIFLSVLFILILKKDKNSLVIFLLVLILMLTVIYPRISVDAVKQGINLWLYIIIPSLMPYFIINDTLSALKFPEFISKLFYKSSYILFNTSGYGIYAFIMSIFSGYPTGAKIVSNLLKDNKISKNEGQQILTFSSTSGPLFIIGAVGTGMLSNPKAGYILFFSHIAGTLLNSVIYRFVIPNKAKQKYELSYTPEEKNYSEIFSSSILSSLKTCGIIGGYIIIFSQIIAIIDKTGFIIKFINILIPYSIPNKSNIIYNIDCYIKSVLEISNGCKIISSMPVNQNLKMCILSFLIAFSGISVMLQVSSVLGKTGINNKLYMISKISHGILSSIICYIIVNIYPDYINCSNINNPVIYKNPYISIIIMLLILTVIPIYAFIKSKKDSYISH